MTKIRCSIQCTPHFTQSLWEQTLHRQNLVNSAQIEVDFLTDSRPDATRFSGSVAAFLIAPGGVLSKVPETMKLLYSGISGVDPALQANNPDCQVASSKGIAAGAIAEYCLMAAMLHTRKFPELYARHQKRKWSQEGLLGGAIQPLSYKKVAVLGLGSNGMEIVRQFKLQGCRVDGLSRSRKNTDLLDSWHGTDELHNLLSSADIVILALPSDLSTRNIINQKSLAIMKRDAFLINIGRGDLIDETALYQHMKSGGLAGAMLDVVAEEPLSRRSKLWRLDNLIITPHISGNINNHVGAIQLDFFKKLSQIADR